MSKARTNASTRSTDSFAPNEVSGAVSAVDAVVHEIRDGVREHRYAPGQRLIEADLVKRLGVGRGTVRDALRRLAGDGIVRVEHRKGAIVRFLSRNEFISLIQVREVLEGLAARLAAENANKRRYLAELQRLQRETNNVRRAGNAGIVEFMDHNDRFHNLIVEMAGDPYLGTAIRQSHGPLFRLQFHFLIDEASTDRARIAHDQIVRAILASDGDKAERAMRSHIHGSIALVKSAPDRLFRQHG